MIHKSKENLQNLLSYSIDLLPRSLYHPCNIVIKKVNFHDLKNFFRCRCDKDHICTYERTDMKMRIYRHSCTPKDSKDYD